MAGAIFLGVLPVWASLRQRALDKAIAEINKEDGLKHCTRVAAAITPSVGNDADFRD
jgi:hypothetical protein